MKGSCWRVWAAAVVATLAVGTSGCLISYDADSAEVEQFVSDTTTPRLIVVSPKPQESFSSELPVSLELRNLSLGAGGTHLRVYIDGVCLDDPGDPGPGGNDFCPRPRAIVQESFGVDIGGLSPGPHRLQVEVRASDGGPLTYTGPDNLVHELRPVIVDFVKL
jgi:hypothetical protein